MNIYLQEFVVINPERIVEIRGFDASGALFEQLVEIYKGETNDRIPELVASLEKNDLQRAAFVVHRFKSTLLNLGAVRAAEVARILETEIIKEKVDKGLLRSLTSTLVKESAKACEVLNLALKHSA